MKNNLQKSVRMAAGVEIPFWIFGQQKWVSGINKNTTCQEVSCLLKYIVMNIKSFRHNQGLVKGAKLCLNP